jgi:hypothetical protein
MEVLGIAHTCTGTADMRCSHLSWDMPQALLLAAGLELWERLCSS